MRLVDLNPVREPNGGISFLCPHGCGATIVLDLRWKITGDSFETLTVSPSVNFERHWHGFITNGAITTA